MIFSLYADDILSVRNNLEKLEKKLIVSHFLNEGRRRGKLITWS